MSGDERYGWLTDFTRWENGATTEEEILFALDGVEPEGTRDRSHAVRAVLGRTNDHGNTALHFAAAYSNADNAGPAVACLLRNGADPHGENTNEDGETPLHYAALNGTGGGPEVIGLLVAYGADVDAKDTQQEWTPLMRAAESGHDENVSALLCLGADRHARNEDEAVKYGGTAQHYARANGHDFIVQMLKLESTPSKEEIQRRIEEIRARYHIAAPDSPPDDTSAESGSSAEGLC